jgi:hypothetical protein
MANSNTGRENDSLEPQGSSLEALLGKNEANRQREGEAEGRRPGPEMTELQLALRAALERAATNTKKKKAAENADAA